MQVDVCIEQKLRLPKEGEYAEWYGDIDIEGDPTISHYQCADCGKLLDVSADPYDHDALREYLKSLPENQKESK